MSSEVYEIMNSLFLSTDLLHSGRLLVEFANTAYKEKNRATLVNNFYERLYPWGLSEYTFCDFLNNEKKKYFICDEKKAARMYLALLIPAKKSTVKTINEIKTFGEFILSNFTKPVGECISEASLVDILQYLDKKYSFSSKVFSNGKAAFIRIHNTHKVYNSECLALGEGKDSINHFFLYHMKEKGSLKPEVVLFHELGHALHTQCFGDVRKVPDDIICKLKTLGFSGIDKLDAPTQSELFADVLGFGLMYQTPYEKYLNDSYNKIQPDDKMAYKMLVENIIENLTVKATDYS